MFVAYILAAFAMFVFGMFIGFYFGIHVDDEDKRRRNCDICSYKKEENDGNN